MVVVLVSVYMPSLCGRMDSVQCRAITAILRADRFGAVLGRGEA